VRLLVGRCAGRRLAEWLWERVHDVLDASDIAPDPGDRALLQRASDEGRVLINMDEDFGPLTFRHDLPRVGMPRSPHGPAADRIRLVGHVLSHHGPDLEARAVAIVRGDRVRVSRHTC